MKEEANQHRSVSLLSGSHVATSVCRHNYLPSRAGKKTAVVSHGHLCVGTTTLLPEQEETAVVSHGHLHRSTMCGKGFTTDVL